MISSTSVEKDAASSRSASAAGAAGPLPMVCFVFAARRGLGHGPRAGASLTELCKGLLMIFTIFTQKSENVSIFSP